MNGHFISFEGPDGAGKTTILEAMVEHYRTRLVDRLTVTREPGGNPISEAIRAIILDRNNTEMDARTEALLYAAARRQHLTETILPALARGQVVFCDRYVDSSIAYQGAGREIGPEAVYQMNLFATEGCLPEKTIYLDVSAEVGLKRIMTHRTDDVDRLDLEQLDFHERVRDAYLALAKRYPERIVVIDASQSIGDVKKAVINVLDQILK
ncbi:dTMP kinase [Pediococcus acidilactici]|uniref:Thymidylate kinase n=1 Tax=Pediococcus acidilactici TaxID=1254 RepID=A0AAW8YJN3_PEDAC|nr:dTMP kinase [Pediococcus acidilactici]EOA09567.1 thymidylate kinase, tmk [Pediococcus acidilactici D3]GAC45923.1 thymidylate kinase [Pediococcus acidilactici NGRI 0510Q]KRN90978.1 thymidylate kinase [Pediococcus acidilactici]MBW4797324.1 dTMP kinase [Pediococcus acidilactici]MBW9306713.1 dTMP kinase [Pediococcus acidilactici]